MIELTNHSGECIPRVLADDGDGTANGYDLTPFGGLPDILSSEVVQKERAGSRLLDGNSDSIYHMNLKMILVRMTKF